MAIGCGTRRSAWGINHRTPLLALVGAVGLACVPDRPVPFRAPSRPPDAAGAEVGDGGGPPPKQRPCAPDVPSRVTLAAIQEADVVLVTSEGASRSIYHFQLFPARSGVSFTANLVMRGDNVLATATWRDASGGECTVEDGRQTCPETDRAALLALDGGVVWEKQRSSRTHAGSTGISARLGDQGWAVLAGGFGGVLVAPDGTETDLPAEAWGGRPFSDPAVPARLIVPGTAKTLFAWWRPNQPLAPTDPPIELPPVGEPFDAGDELDFLGIAPDGARVIVHARPDRTAVLPDRLDVGLGAVVASGPWRATVDGSTVTTFDLATGRTRRLAWSLPPGLRALGPVAVSHEGGLLRPLRDDETAAAYVSSDGSDWSPIGRTLGQVETASVQDFAGTHLVIAKGIDDFFVPTQQWPDGSTARMPELLGASVQLVRPSIGLASVITPAWYPVKVSSDGLCAAYWETAPSGARLVIHDLVRDIRTPTLDTHAAWPPAFGFIE